MLTWTVETKTRYRGPDEEPEPIIDQRTHCASATKFGGPLPHRPMGGVKIEEHFHYPGGPGFGFSKHDAESGGRGFDYITPEATRRWPVVTLKFALPHERLDLRAELTEELKRVCEAFVAKHQLEDE